MDLQLNTSIVVNHAPANLNLHGRPLPNQLMARTMPVLAAAGGRRHLVDLSATPPSAGNWAGQDSGFTKSKDTTNQLLFLGTVLIFLAGCWCVGRLFCHNRDDDEEEQQTSSDGHGPQSNGGEGGGRAPEQEHEQQQQPASATASRDARGLRNNSGEGGGRAQRRRQQQQPPAVAAPAVDVELAQAPVLRCTFRTEDGWAENMCSVCLSEMADGEAVMVLTACMHCFHTTCVRKWLRQRGTCPLCRAPSTVGKGRRHRRTAST